MMKELQSPIVRFGIAMGACIALIGGPISGYFLTKMFLEARASANWPSANGVISKAEVGTSGFRYFADVRYSYRVDGNEFVGSRVRASDGEYNKFDGAARMIRGLSVDQVIPVYYDPLNHERSVLYPGAGFQEYVLLIFPLAMTGGGIGAICVLWTTRRRTFRREESRREELEIPRV